MSVDLDESSEHQMKIMTERRKAEWTKEPDHAFSDAGMTLGAS